MNFKFVSWNVKRKNFGNINLEFLLDLKADIILFQEIRPAYKELPDNILEGFSKYLPIWNNIGSGMAVYSLSKDIKSIRIDFDGCIMTVEYENFFVVNVYAPSFSMYGTADYNSWHNLFKKFLVKHNEIKPVIAGGTFNFKTNFVDIPYEEKKVMNNLIRAGFIDTFQKIFPDKTDAYTYRIRRGEFDRRTDYFFVSENLNENIKSADIIEEDLETAHRPIILDVKLEYDMGNKKNPADEAEKINVEHDSEDRSCAKENITLLNNKVI